MTHLGLDVALHGRVAARINDLRPKDAPVSLRRTRLESYPGKKHRSTQRRTPPSRAETNEFAGRRLGGRGATAGAARTSRPLMAVMVLAWRCAWVRRAWRQTWRRAEVLIIAAGPFSVAVCLEQAAAVLEGASEGGRAAAGGGGGALPEVHVPVLGY